MCVSHSMKSCMMHAVIATAIIVSLTHFYARLDHLRLVAQETNFSPAFTPKLAISPRRGYQLNLLVHHSSDLVQWRN